MRQSGTVGPTQGASAKKEKKKQKHMIPPQSEATNWLPTFR